MNIDKQYQNLLQDILDNGVEKDDRTGTGTISVFGRQIRHKMSEGFPLLTTKKMHWHSIVTELIWFLRGDTNIQWLLQNNNTIWVGDAYKYYLSKETTPGIPPHDHVLSKKEFIDKIKTDDEFAKKWGDMGPIYGKQWRQWQGWVVKNGEAIGSLWYDQIAMAIHKLKTNPDSRRIKVSAWNVGELEDMKLPPCHYGFQFYTRKLTYKEKYSHHPELLTTYLEKIEAIKNQEYEKAAKAKDKEKNILDSLPELPERALSLMFNQRSVDTFLGLPFNIASYALLLKIIAKEVNMIPDELIGNLGDTHLYLNHIEQAKEQISRKPMKLPTVTLDYRDGEYNKNLKEFVPDDFVLFNYDSHPTIKAPLSN